MESKNKSQQRTDDLCEKFKNGNHEDKQHC